MNISTPLLDWYGSAARPLPWRESDATPWAVLVSEFMLQQTPVARVLPVYERWLERWPGAKEMAVESAGEAVRAWGKLGYPRRALRLHACARVIVAEHGGEVPADVATLLALPGIGEYTARAISAFAFAQRVPVVDTNVRRVVARAVTGQAAAGRPSTVRDLASVDALLPGDPSTAARFSVALMELGALVCVAGTPRCGECPLIYQCRWRELGYPVYDGPAVAPQRFAGTDRQVRGRLLDVLRARQESVGRNELDLAWPDPVQRDRALTSLLTDGLVIEQPGERYALPA